MMKFKLDKLYLFVLVIFFLFISIPEIKIILAPIGILLFFLFLSVCLFYFKTLESIISSWIIVSPFLGYGFDLYGLTISLTEIFFIVLIFNFVFKSIKFDFNYLFFKSTIGLLSFLLIIYLSLFFSPVTKPLVANFSIIKVTLNITFIILVLSIPKPISFLERVLKSFVSLGLFALLLWFYEIFVFRLQNESIFRTPSINSLVLFYAIGIISYNFLRYRKNLKPKWFFIILLISLSVIATTRSGLIYCSICVIMNIIILKKMKFLANDMIFILSCLLVISLVIISNVVLSDVNLNRASSNSERYDVLFYYFTVIKEYFFLGLGFGNWFSSISLISNDGFSASVYSDALGETSLNPHNTFLRIAVDTGVLGVIVFIILLINLFKNMKFFFNKIMFAEFYVPIFFSVLIVSFFISDIIETSFFWSFFLLGVGKLSTDV
jgi:O-antigen ligase